jgi:hypothetical protein
MNRSAIRNGTKSYRNSSSNMIHWINDLGIEAEVHICTNRFR